MTSHIDLVEQETRQRAVTSLLNLLKEQAEVEENLRRVQRYINDKVKQLHCPQHEWTTSGGGFGCDYDVCGKCGYTRCY